jgi:hypothetical protein
MPQNITDVDEFTATVTSPADGDTRNAGSVLASFQIVANRTKWLYNTLTSRGISKIRKVTSTTDLKALASPVEGDVAILSTGSVPQIFVYRSVALAGSDLSQIRYDSTVSTGQWLSPWYWLVDASGASPRLDVNVLPPPNRIQNVQNEFSISPSATNATEAGSVFGPTMSLAVLAGDKIVFDAHTTLAMQSADAFGYIAIAVDGTDQPQSKRLWTADGTGANLHLQTSLLYDVVSSATLTIRLYQKITTLTSGTPQLIGPQTIRALVLRP